LQHISGTYLSKRNARLTLIHPSHQAEAATTSPDGTSAGAGGDYSSGASHVLGVIHDTLNRHRALETK